MPRGGEPAQSPSRPVAPSYLHTIALLLLATLAACSPCREYCTEYTEALAAFTDPWADLRPGGNDHVVVALTGDALTRFADGAAAALERRLRAAVPAEIVVPLVEWRVHTEVSVRPTAFVPVPNAAGAGVLFGLSVRVGLSLPPEVGGGAGALEGELRLGTALVVADGEPPTLSVRLRDSRLDRLRLTPVGLGGLGRFVDELSRLVESALRQALRPEVLAQLGDVPLLELRPLRLGGATVRVAVNRLWVDAPSGRLAIGLRTDLVGAARIRPAPLPDTGAGDLTVGLSPELGAPLLGSVLAVDGGRRFDEGGGADVDGPYGVVVSELTPRSGGVAFGYRLYRLSVPCLVADFAGEADLSWGGDGPAVAVRRHDLVYASRFEGAVREAQPPVERLSRELTALLGRTLAVEAVTLPPGLRVGLEPVSLTVSERGYVVGWRVTVR